MKNMKNIIWTVLHLIWVTSHLSHVFFALLYFFSEFGSLNALYLRIEADWGRRAHGCWPEVELRESVKRVDRGAVYCWREWPVVLPSKLHAGPLCAVCVQVGGWRGCSGPSTGLSGPPGPWQMWDYQPQQPSSQAREPHMQGLVYCTKTQGRTHCFYEGLERHITSPTPHTHTHGCMQAGTDIHTHTLSSNGWTRPLACWA
jgi:hypothetical protein